MQKSNTNNQFFTAETTPIFTHQLLSSAGEIPTYTPISPQYSHSFTQEHTQNQAVAPRWTKENSNMGAAPSFHQNTSHNSTSAAPFDSTSDVFHTRYQNNSGGFGTGQEKAFTNSMGTRANEAGAGSMTSIKPNFTQHAPAQNSQNAHNTQNPPSLLAQSGENRGLQAVAKEFLEKIIMDLPTAAALATQAPPFFPHPNIHQNPTPTYQTASASPTTPLTAPFFSTASRIPQPNFQQNSQATPLTAQQPSQPSAPQIVTQAGFLTTQQNDGATLSQPKSRFEAKEEHHETSADQQTGSSAGAAQALSASETYWNTLSPSNTEYLQSTPARKTLKSYLQERCSYLDGEEIEEILMLAKELETQAVEVFKAKGTHKTKLQEQNRQAIDKLNTQSAKMHGSNPTQTATFTRKQISEMSMDEFIANQAQILSQYAKGAIN